MAQCPSLGRSWLSVGLRVCTQALMLQTPAKAPWRSTGPRGWTAVPKTEQGG